MDGQQDKKDKDNEGGDQPQIVDITPPDTAMQSLETSNLTTDGETSGVDATSADVTVPTEEFVAPTSTTNDEVSSTTEAPVEVINETEPTVTNITVNTESEDVPDTEQLTTPTSIEPVVPPPPIAVDSDDSNTGEDVHSDESIAAAVTAEAAAIPTATKKHVSIVPIIISLVIALGLAMLTIYAYQKTKKTDTKTSLTSTNATTTPTKETVSSKDIDDVSATADEVLANDDIADTAANELSDTSLGL